MSKKKMIPKTINRRVVIRLSDGREALDCTAMAITYEDVARLLVYTKESTKAELLNSIVNHMIGAGISHIPEDDEEMIEIDTLQMKDNFNHLAEAHAKSADFARRSLSKETRELLLGLI